MFEKLFGKFIRDDGVFFPDMKRRDVEKLEKLEIVSVKKAEDVNKLRKILERSGFIIIHTLPLLMGTDKKSFVKRLKVLCKPLKMNVYGIDRNWLIVTKYPVKD